jgi:hypothetical protein
VAGSASAVGVAERRNCCFGGRAWSLDAAELGRALTATIEAFDTELRQRDPALANRLKPLLTA